MKRLYVIFPLTALTAFTGYYAFWRTTEGPRNTNFTRDAYANRNGEQEAQTEKNAGQFVVLSYGLPAEWSPEYREILLKNYGIQHRMIAGCEVSQPLVDYAASYNRIMRDHIKSTFGADVFENAKNDALKLYMQRHSQNGANHTAEPASPGRGGSS